MGTTLNRFSWGRLVVGVVAAVCFLLMVEQTSAAQMSMPSMPSMRSYSPPSTPSFRSPSTPRTPSLPSSGGPRWQNEFRRGTGQGNAAWREFQNRNRNVQSEYRRTMGESRRDWDTYVQRNRMERLGRSGGLFGLRARR